MGQAAAKQGDQIIATDTHIVMVPGPGSPVPTPLPHPFSGIINGNLSGNVNILGNRRQRSIARPRTRQRTCRRRPG
jgi:hypothetical protein